MRHITVAVALLFLVCSAGSAAVTNCPTAATPFATYTAFNIATNGCQIDDKIFYGFVDLVTGVGASTAGVGITVTPIATLFNPGFAFTLSGFSVTSNQSLDLKLAFVVATISGAKSIEDASLGIAGAQNSGTGMVNIGENVCVGGTFSTPIAGSVCSTGSSPPNEISLNVQNPGPPVKLFDMQFTTLTNLVSAFKDVGVLGGTSGSASLSSFTQQFSEIPEPSSIMLLGTALLLAFRRKRAKP